MKRQIRRGVYETNSSSVHTLTIATKDEYNQWVNGKSYYDYDGLHTLESIKEYFRSRNVDVDSMSEEEFKEFIRDCDYQTYDEFWDSEYLEPYEETYTSPSGDELVIFGKTGYDG